jgi:hypothetical protein
MGKIDDPWTRTLKNLQPGMIRLLEEMSRPGVVVQCDFMADNRLGYSFKALGSDIKPNKKSVNTLLRRNFIVTKQIMASVRILAINNRGREALVGIRGIHASKSNHASSSDIGRDQQ